MPRNRSAIATVCALALAASAVVALTPADAFAYIDPGTGSFIIQGVIAAVVAVGFAVKLYWRKIKAVFSGKNTTDENDNCDV